MVFGPFGLKTGMDFRGHCMRSENGFGKWHVLVWNRVRIWWTRQHNPTKNSQEYPHPPPPPHEQLFRLAQNVMQARHFQVAPAEPLLQSEAKWEAIHVFFYSNANKTHFHQKGFAFTFVLKVRVLEVGNSQNHQEWNSWRPHLSLESERNFRRPVYISSIQRLIISKLHSRLFQLLKSFLLALLLKYIFFTEIF